jgi:tripartite-type tricarboxylate transporter receptor subunit TctC
MRLLRLVMFSMLVLVPAESYATNYPGGPIRIIVPFPAGGTVDVVARLVGHKLQESFAQPVIIENRPGASGNIAADAVAKSAPDGHTILLTTNGQASTPAVFRKLPYDPVKDIIPVTQLNSSTIILVATPKLPVTSVPELVEFAKSKPGSLSYGSTGIGNPLHLTMEMLKLRTGIEAIMVPYRGDAPLITALIAGEVELAVIPVPTALPHIQSGALRALGLTRAKRTSALPEVPTISEQGFPGFDTASWHGFFVAAKTPQHIVLRIYQETKKALEASEVRNRLLSLGAEPVATSPEEFSILYKADIEKFKQVVRDAGISPLD